MALALFDFDGTITNQDTYTKFIFFSSSRARMVIGLTLVFPVILLYKLGLLPASKTRPILSKVVFWNRSEKEVSKISKVFALEYLPTVVRKNAMQRIDWHKKKGDTIVVVSASLNIYLSFWCQENNVQLVCSELESKKSKLTGRYIYGDCSSYNKVTEIKRQLDLSMYDHIFAYGDTEEDLPMLGIAHEKYYQWQKIA